MIRSDSDELINRILSQHLSSTINSLRSNKDVASSLPNPDYSEVSIKAADTSHGNISTADTEQPPPQESMFQRILRASNYLFMLMLALWLLTMYLVSSSFSMSNESSFYKMTTKLFASSDHENSTSYLENKTEWNSYGASIYDSFDGNLSVIYDSINKNELTFVYLYANWCARSMSYRDLIAKLASRHASQMPFIAVNCFSSKGECRSSFNLVRYPQILVYVRNIGFLVYKGPFEYNYLDWYLKTIQKPIERIDSFEEFIDFILIHDRTVLGNFNFSNDSDSQIFNTFYQASLRSLNIDSENPIRYGVVVNKALWKRINRLDPAYNAKKRRRIAAFSAFGFERTLKNVRNIHADNLVNWAYRNLKQTIPWYHPDRTQSRRELNQFLIFYPRVFGHELNQNTKQILYTIKSLILENYYNVHHHGSSLFYEYLVDHRFGWLMGENSSRSKDTKFLANYFRPKMRSRCESNFEMIERFVQQTEFFLTDSNLYSSYAMRLMSNITTRQPFSLLVDFRNESTYLFENESFDYANIKKFIQNHQSGLNRRLMRSSQINNKQAEVKNIEGINSKILDLILNQKEDLIKLRYQNKDLLVFFYNNWCGFCNLMNHQLTVLAFKYFKNVDTFKIIKVDASKNDFPWYIHPHRVPSLLLVPSSDVEPPRQRETVTFDLSSVNNQNQQKFEIKHLVKFILENARNPLTLLSFLRDNYLDRNKKNLDKDEFDLSTSSKLRYDLINIISNRLKTLRVDINHLTELAANHSSDQVDENRLGLDARVFKTKLNRLNFELDVMNNFTNFFH